MSALVERIVRFIKTYNLLEPKATVLVGLSGGPDSVFLTRLLASLRKTYSFTLVAAHLDHCWRVESQQDAIFCTQLCKELGVPLITKRLTDNDYDALPTRNKGSREEQGRLLRRHFFEAVQKEHGATAIALAHHRDDNIETFFIRLMRGASITGLTGIKPRNGIYIHPLLCCSKQEIISFLNTQGIPFLHDHTNDTDLFLRNRIRHHAIPALERCDTRFHQSLINTMTQLQETELFLEELSKSLLVSLSCQQEIAAPLQLDIQRFLAQQPFIQKRILLKWLITECAHFTPSQALFEEIIRFFHQKKSQRHLLYHSFYIVKSKGYARLEQKV